MITRRWRQAGRLYEVQCLIAFVLIVLAIVIPNIAKPGGRRTPILTPRP